jgi:two-component system cell cycle response regulator PopA
LRIVVRAADARVAREAQALLDAAGFAAAALAGPYRPAPDGEDISIIPQHGAGAGALAASIASAADRPLAHLAGYVGASLAAELPETTYTGAVCLDAPPALLRAQLHAWIRLAIAEEESTRRSATAAALGVASPAPAPERKLAALYIGAPSSMFLALEQAFAEQGGSLEAAFSSYAGFDRLHDEPFDAVVLNGVNDPNTALSLCGALRRNATLHNVPTLMLAKPGDAATAEVAIERGASAISTSHLPSFKDLAWLFEAIRRERRRNAAEHQMRALRDLMGDARTGLWLRAPFETHLARMAADHHSSGRPMSVVALRVTPAIGAREPSPEVWRKGFAEIASLAARLMREADCGAAFGPDVIALALPAARLQDARRTAERISSVAECTAFAAGDGGAGPLIFEQSVVEMQPGESGAAMLARALRAIEVEAVPA